jgi:hypothetical protein
MACAGNGQSRRGLAKVAHDRHDFRINEGAGSSLAAIGRHSRQVSPIEFRTSLTAATASSGKTVKGGPGTRRLAPACENAGWHGPASSRAPRIRGWSLPPAPRLPSCAVSGRPPFVHHLHRDHSCRTNPLPHSPFRAANKGRGSRIAESAAFPRVLPSDCTTAPGEWRFSLLPLSALMRKTA